MATNSFNVADGNWSDGTKWSLARAPNNTDDVVIVSPRVCTLDTTGLVALSLTVNSGATLSWAAAATASVVIQNGVVNSGTLSFDGTSNASKTLTFLVNNANNPAGATSRIDLTDVAPFTLKGASKTRWTTTNAQITAAQHLVTCVDATGWRNGDVIALSTTDAYASPPHTDLLTLGPNGGDTYTNGSSSLCFTSSPTYTHSSGCVIANLTSNLIFGPANAGSLDTTGRNFSIQYSKSSYASSSTTKIFQDCQFNGLNGDYPDYGLTIRGLGVTATDSPLMVINNNVFYDFRYAAGLQFNTVASPTAPRTNNVFYSANQNTGDPLYGAVAPYSTCTNIGNDSGLVVIRANAGFTCPAVGYTMTGAKISGIGATGSALELSADPVMTLSGVDIWGCNKAVSAYNAGIAASNCTFGTKFGSACNTVFASMLLGQMVAANCSVQSTGTIFSASGALNSTNLSLVNKNSDLALQEIYWPYGTIKRNNSTVTRSTSSVAIAPTTTGVDTQYTVSIPCANGATIRVVGYVKADTNFYNGGGSNWTPPTVTLGGTINGVTLTTATYTASSSANNAFEQINDGGGNSYLACTNSSGVDGNLTLTFTANAKSVTTGMVYFDGMPTNSPYVTKARHYGYTFDQTLPQATVNACTSANEATAAGYTGITVTGGSTTSSVALGASHTFQELYDYTQAWACLNLSYAVPISAPAPGSYIAGGNLTTTGYSLAGAGSLAMGSYTLASEFTGSYSYTYTGGTWSQPSATPSFSGGTLTLGTAGIYPAFGMSSAEIKFTATSAAWDLSAGQFSGAITLTNTSGAPITVAMPSVVGFTIVNTGVGAAAITVTSPPITYAINVSGFRANSMLRVDEVDNAGNVVANLYGPAIPGGGATSVTITGTYAHDMIVRLRRSYVTSTTADNFVDQVIGTITSTSLTINYLDSPVVNTVYRDNLVDGSAITDCSITGTSLHVDVNSGSTTWQHIYAYMTYWLYTTGGITDQFLEMTATDQTHYVFSTAHGAFKVKNVTTGPTVPLLITGGNAKPDSGSITGILDTTGGSIFCIEDQVVPFTTSSQAVNQATVQAAMDAQGYTLSRAPKIDNIAPASSIASAVWSQTLP